MLEGLFGDDGGGGDGDLSYQVTSSTGSKTTIDKPISPRNETNLCGLQNQGATCYLSALIQTLLFTPDFREPLFSLSAKDLNLAVPSNDSSQTSSNGSTLKVRKIIVELQRLFAEMLLLNQQACSSIRLTDSFGWQSNETFDHQDVQKQSNLIRSCYEGSTINYTQCKRCERIFKRIEDYQDLPMVVQDSPNLQTSLANMFTIHEQLIGDNQYRCSSCANQLCDADKWAKISKLPPILTLPLQRFVYDIKTGNRLKKTTRYEFPFDIDLKEFCEDSVTETNYELFAVVIHKGTCYSGHYYGYIKDIDQIGTWTRPPPSTSSSTKSSNKQKPSTTRNGNTPNNTSRNHRNPSTNDPVESEEEITKKIELLKTILLSCDDWFTIDDLLKTYRDNTTVPWSRTRNSNGAFTKFLRNYPDIFHVDDKRIRLVEQMDVDENEITDMDYESSQNDKSETNGHENEHWFCFDDSHVTCVTQQHIQRHYGLNDCAYMLFYRLKNNRKRIESIMDCSDSFYSIPQWLMEEITDKNKILEEKRDIYEKHQNQLPVTIYPSDWFEVIDGYRLNLNNDHQGIFPDQYGEHTFDKRTKLDEFIGNLKDMYGVDCRFYVAKKLRSGQLHVISELRNLDEDITLDKNDLSSYRHIIVFKRPSIIPDTVLQGEEFEPIMLNIVYGFPDAPIDPSRIQTTRHMPKNTTLSQLKEILFRDYYQCDDEQTLRQVRMGKLNLEEKNNRKSRREYKIDEENQTLTQLHLRDGDTLGVDNKNSFVPSWKDVSSTITNMNSSQLSLTIKNNIDSTNTTRSMTCSCFNTTLIGDVKSMAIRAFGLSLDPLLCRLHIDDDSDLAHIPLNDYQSVDTIEFKQNNTNLCLKSGQALKQNEIVLYILSDREPNPLELIVDISITLRDLWNLIKQSLHMHNDDNEYHLCEVKASLINDGPPLNDFDQILLVNGLTNGAQLTMRSGSVAPRNHVRLKIFRIINKYYKPMEAIHTRPKFEMTELPERFELPITCSFNVLRERIAKCIDFKVPLNSTNDVQSTEFIRLYDIEDDQPTSLVHEPMLTTLKQAKVRDLCSYAFEILSHPEYITKKDLLLHIVYCKDNVKNFFEQKCELLLPMRDNSILKYEYLEQQILSYLKSLVNNEINKITLARYFPERSHWMIIDPLVTTKKTKTSGVNLRLEPYKLTDFAVIGVLEGEYSASADFETQFDQIKREELEQEKEQKRINRERNRADNDHNQQNGSSARRKSPQNTMRIKVDDFDD